MDFLGLGPLEVLLIFVVILIVFGPGKLPEIAGQLGKVVREVRKAASDMTGELTKEVEAAKTELQATKSELQSFKSDVEAAVPAPPVPGSVILTPKPPSNPEQKSP